MFKFNQIKENYLSIRKNSWLSGNKGEIEYVENVKSPAGCRFACYRCPNCQAYCWNKEYNRCTFYSNLKNTQLVNHPHYECGLVSEKNPTVIADGHINDLLREKNKQSIKNYFYIPKLRTLNSYYSDFINSNPPDIFTNKISDLTGLTSFTRKNY